MGVLLSALLYSALAFGNALDETAGKALYELFRGKSCPDYALSPSECEGKAANVDLLEPLYFQESVKFRRMELKCQVSQLEAVGESVQTKGQIIAVLQAKLPAIEMLIKERQALIIQSRAQFADSARLRERIQSVDILLQSVLSSIWMSESPQIQALMDRVTSAMTSESQKVSQSWPNLRRQLQSEISSEFDGLLKEMLADARKTEGRLAAATGDIGKLESETKKSLASRSDFIDRFARDGRLSDAGKSALICRLEARHTVGPRYLSDTLTTVSFMFLGMGFLTRAGLRLTSAGAAPGAAKLFRASRGLLATGGSIGLTESAHALAVACLEDRKGLETAALMCSGVDPVELTRRQIDNGNCLLQVAMNAAPAALAFKQLPQLRFLLARKWTKFESEAEQIAEMQATGRLTPEQYNVAVNAFERVGDAVVGKAIRLDPDLRLKFGLSEDFAVPRTAPGYWAMILERPKDLDLEETIHVLKAYSLDSIDEARKVLRQSRRFTEKEVHRILEDVPQFLPPRAAADDAYKFWDYEDLPKASLMSPKLESLEKRLTAIESKLVFEDEYYEKNLFYYFRRTRDAALARSYVHTDRAVLDVHLQGKVELAQTVADDYQRVISVVENLGTPKMKNFDKKFGHVDSQGSNLFSLRLNPRISVTESGKARFDADPNLRALLCKDTSGAVHVLKVYRKLTYYTAEGFKQLEDSYYEEARAATKKKGITCINPVPL